jgi:protein TonB
MPTFAAFEHNKQHVKLKTFKVMKTRITALALLATLVFTSVYAQKTVVGKKGQNTDAVFEVVEQMPEFPGGSVALFSYLSENLHYPKDAVDKKIEGRVMVQFIVNSDGSVVESKVLKEVFPSLDAEGLRVINAMPKWTPGMQKGKPVRVRYTVPIMFRLNDEKKD